MPKLEMPKLVNAEKEIALTPGYLVSRSHELFQESFQKKIEQLSNIPNGKYIVAEKDGELIGHAFLDPMGLEAIQQQIKSELPASKFCLDNKTVHREAVDFRISINQWSWCYRPGGDEVGSI